MSRQEARDDYTCSLISDTFALYRGKNFDISENGFYFSREDLLRLSRASVGTGKFLKMSHSSRSNPSVSEITVEVT